MKISSNVVGDSDDENDSSHKLSLTNTQVSKLRKAFSNNSSANIKLSKSQLHTIGHSGEFLGRLSGPLLKNGLSLTRNVLKTLAKSVLIPLGLTVAASATDATVHKKTFGSGRLRSSGLPSCNTTLIISNEAMNNIMKIIRSLEESGLLIKDVIETIKIEAKEQMLLDTFDASLLGNLLTGKGTVGAGEGTVRVVQDF